MEVSIYEKRKVVYVKEILYEKGMTTDQIIRWIEDSTLDTSRVFYCDYQESEKIFRLQEANINAENCITKDISARIMRVKEYTLYIHESSQNTRRELINYQWDTDRHGSLIDQKPKPRQEDHAMDAMGYAIHSAIGDVIGGIY